MRTVRDDFIAALFQLSKASQPEAWDKFLRVFDSYVAYELERGLSSQTQDVLISVGMGRRLREMRDDFKNVEEIYRKITKERE